MSVVKPLIQITPSDNTVTVQPPLSRRGTGPGLILIVAPDIDLGRASHDKTLDPPPQQKWAEEGFAVAQMVVAATADTKDFSDRLDLAVKGLLELPECTPKTNFGVIIMHDSLPPTAFQTIDSLPAVAAIIFYGNNHHYHNLLSPNTQVLAHLPGSSSTPGPFPGAAPDQQQHHIKSYTYPNLSSQATYFTIPTHSAYSPTASSVSHTRSLSFLKPLLSGPYFDLEAIWDEHTLYEFGDRSVEKTMDTMVDQPYVNHIPTMTGGVGRENLTRFYRDHFIFSNPDDARLELVSRTVGVDRVVDEFLFECTHSSAIDWLIPGIPPTQKPLSVPMTSIVNIRGDRLYHEHISWDQGTVLRQLGLLPEYLPFPYPVPLPVPVPMPVSSSTAASSGHDSLGAESTQSPLTGEKEMGSREERHEYRVPVAGIEAARKLKDEASEPSNEMLQFTLRKAQ